MTRLREFMVGPHTIATISPNAIAFLLVSNRELCRMAGFTDPVAAKEIAKNAITSYAADESPLERVAFGGFATTHSNGWSLRMHPTAEHGAALRLRSSAHNLKLKELTGAEAAYYPRKIIGATVADINIGSSRISPTALGEIRNDKVLRALLPRGADLPLGPPTVVDMAAPDRAFTITSEMAAAWLQGQG